MRVIGNTWLNENKQDIIFKFVAFGISPILGIVAALLRPNTRSSYIVLLLSFICIGLSINIPYNSTEDVEFDSSYYRRTFESYSSINSADFGDIVREYRHLEGETDIYSGLIFYTVSLISNNYHVCFMVIALIFSIFMLKSMRFLVSEQNYRTSFVCLLLLFLFTICQIQKINAFRFYTAYWIALYAIFMIIQNNKKEYWFLLCLTPIVHASFFIIIFIMLMYYLMRQNYKIAIFLVVISILFSTIAVEVFSWIILHLPDSLGGHYSAYINEWYIQKINESGTGYIWAVRLMEFLIRFSVNAIVLFFTWKYKNNILGSKCNNLYFLLLSVLAFVNFTFMIPSVGSRYVMFAFPLIAYIWLVCFINENKYNWIISSFAALYLIYFLFLPWNIYQIPCFKYYTMLWEADVIYASPLYLAIKYTLLY